MTTARRSLEAVRSILFTPGDDRRKLERALNTDCDAVVADLEDAVTFSRKAEARRIIADVYSHADSPPLRAIRVNSVSSGLARDDLALADAVPLDALVVPKATPEDVEAVGGEGPPIFAIVETAQGVRLAYEIAVAGRVAALMLGAIDLALEVGLESRPDGLELAFARSTIAFASAAAQICGPFDTAYIKIGDMEGLERESRLARTFAFQGKICVHPAQVAIVNRVFSPTTEDLELAASIVKLYDAAVAEGRGAVALEGLMIDLPVAERARRLLARQRGLRPNGD